MRDAIGAWTIPQPKPYGTWRVQSPDGAWHRVERYFFRYHQAPRNLNDTYCGHRLDDPPFMELWDGDTFAMKAEPMPACVHCANLVGSGGTR